MLVQYGGNKYKLCLILLNQIKQKKPLCSGFFTAKIHISNLI